MPGERRAFGMFGSLEDDLDAHDQAEAEAERREEAEYRRLHPITLKKYGAVITVPNSVLADHWLQRHADWLDRLRQAEWERLQDWFNAGVFGGKR